MDAEWRKYMRNGNSIRQNKTNIDPISMLLHYWCIIFNQTLELHISLVLSNFKFINSVIKTSCIWHVFFSLFSFYARFICDVRSLPNHYIIPIEKWSCMKQNAIRDACHIEWALDTEAPRHLLGLMRACSFAHSLIYFIYIIHYE